MMRKSASLLPLVLFKESEHDGEHNAEKGNDVIPLQLFAPEHKGRYQREHYERQCLLYNL